MSAEKLEEYLKDHPDDIESWLVLGDWFQEQSDPRGEFIAIEARIRQCTNEAEVKSLMATKEALIEEHQETLLGPLISSYDVKFTVKWGLLTTLDLGYNGIGAEGARAIAESKHLSNLTTLELGGNDIGAEGARAIAESKHLSNLTYLNLWDNGIGAEGARAIAESKHLSNLTTLELGGNDIEDEGARAIIESSHLSSKCTILI